LIKQLLAIFAAVTCLTLVVHLRENSQGYLPSLSIAAPRRVATTVSHTLTIQEPEMESPPFVIKPKKRRLDQDNQAFVGAVPEGARNLGSVIRVLHAKTVATFETSPNFGRGRGGFGGGQFGNAPLQPPQLLVHPQRRHTPVQARYDYRRGPNNLEVSFSKASDYQNAWRWSDCMCGLTPQGFVYNTNGQLVVAPPNEFARMGFLNFNADIKGAVALDNEADVWDVVEVELVGLLMHSHPIVYDKKVFFEPEVKPHDTRELNPVEAELLEQLRSGSVLTMAWNNQQDFLQVVGAIRAKENAASYLVHSRIESRR
jgi:hypothetical protein